MAGGAGKLVATLPGGAPLSTLPAATVAGLAAFAPLFSRRVWGHARVRLAGARIAPGRRTVAAAPRGTGLDQGRRFHPYHRLLSRAGWPGPAAGRVLLGLLVVAFAPTRPLVFGVDDPLERRRGKRIAAKGIDRDAPSPRRGHLVKASGLRWVRLTLLLPIPWVARTWALPAQTAPAPAERHDAERGRRPKTPTDRARQLLLVVRRWGPDRATFAVADSSHAALALLVPRRGLRRPVTVAACLRLDAAL